MYKNISDKEKSFIMLAQGMMGPIGTCPRITFCFAWQKSTAQLSQSQEVNFLAQTLTPMQQEAIKLGLAQY